MKFTEFRSFNSVLCTVHFWEDYKQDNQDFQLFKFRNKEKKMSIFLVVSYRVYLNSLLSSCWLRYADRFDETGKINWMLSCNVFLSPSFLTHIYSFKSSACTVRFMIFIRWLRFIQLPIIFFINCSNNVKKTGKIVHISQIILPPIFYCVGLILNSPFKNIRANCIVDRIDLYLSFEAITSKPMHLETDQDRSLTSIANGVWKQFRSA